MDDMPRITDILRELESARMHALARAYDFSLCLVSSTASGTSRCAPRSNSSAPSQVSLQAAARLQQLPPAAVLATAYALLSLQPLSQALNTVPLALISLPLYLVTCARGNLAASIATGSAAAATAASKPTTVDRAQPT
ncbi:hypothetical protein HaLaN_18193 [Haematococcus lacustris]|uniref:Uncharacterized protein n=1 Tax=Haematococcus lacustris TaxID=44745 RepID=A0A699ZFK7_HAELA|nr:hypothetical protein HaLaN_18193 [Haematococcus lacustris]